LAGFASRAGGHEDDPAQIKADNITGISISRFIFVNIINDLVSQYGSSPGNF
jgi:hypothetical protein